MKVYINGCEYVHRDPLPGITYLKTQTPDLDENVHAALTAWRHNLPYGFGYKGLGFLNISTSGTTGDPAAVAHSRETIDLVVDSNIKLLNLDKKSRIMSLYSPRGIAFTVLSLYIAEKLGCELYIETFNGLDYINKVNRIRPTHTLILPNIWKVLHGHPRWQQIDFSSCNSLLTGSDFTPSGMLDELRQHGAKHVYNVYGSSEVPPIVLISEEENTYSKQSIPPGCDLEIRNNQIVCRWSTQSQWWISGDCVEGTLDRFVLKGRMQHMFKQNHVRVYPEQIEKQAVSHGAELALCQQVGRDCVLYYTGKLADVSDFQKFFSHIPRFRMQNVPEIKLDNNLKKIIRTQTFC